MKKRDLKKALSALHTIKPSKDYARTSRLNILLVPQKTDTFSSDFVVNGNSKHSFGVVLYANRTMRVASFVVGGAAIVMLAYVATQQLSPLFLPGLSQTKIVAEADSVDRIIDIELQRVTYFKTTSKESSNAINLITTKTLDHLNDGIINSEVQSLNVSSTDPQLNQNINEFLDVINN